MLEEIGFKFENTRDSVIKFPRKNPKEYEELLFQCNKNILDSYEIKVIGDEIWIKENVLNMVFRKF
jgi:hypothetical protein